jgi:HAD superfamily hydrolase (TIGR01484 family)
MNLKNIFFCDFDYTLYDHDNSHVTAENLRAVKRWREQGNLFVIATGRSLNELKVSLPDYRDYCDYLILNDGAVVMTVHNEPLHVDRLSWGTAKHLDEALRRCSFTGNRAVIGYTSSREYDSIREGICKIRLWFSSAEDCLIANGIFKHDLKGKLIGMAYVNTKFNYDVRLPWISEEMQHLIEVNLAGTSKKTGVDAIMARLGNGYNIITIGDSRDDLEMLASFNGYAVDGAHPDVIRRVPSTRIVRNVSDLIAEKLRSSR